MTLKTPLTAFGKPLAFSHRCFWRLLRALVWVLGGRRGAGTGAFPRNGPAVVIAPHTSFLDAPFLAAALPRPPRFIAAAFFVAKNVPLSWLLFLAGVIPVQRHRSDPVAVRRALRLLARGEVVAFFPEGGRTWTGVPSPPMAPAVKLLMGLKVPMYLATVDGAYDYWPRFDPAPRPRKVHVRIVGPLSLGRNGTTPPEADHRRGAVGPWWSDVYSPGTRRRAEVARAAEAIRSQFAAAAAGELDRLRLELPGRLQALTRILCFCPDCIAPALRCNGEGLACPACGLALRAAGKGRLRRIGPGAEMEDNLPVPEVFGRMLARLGTRARGGFSLEEVVDAATVPEREANVGAIAFRPATARLDGAGLHLGGAGCRITVPLPAVAAANVMGSETLEITQARSGMVVYLRAPGGAMRILLAARAFLDLPFETMQP